MNLFQTSKQTPTSLPEICAPRQSLINRFEKASKHPIIYVQAPAGYGKTISTLLWLKQSNCTSIWVSLDFYDNTLSLFYRLFCMSLLSNIPFDPSLEALFKSPTFAANPVECTMEILSRLSYSPGKYALVFDDYHIIQSEAIRKSLPYVLKWLPVSFTVLLLSRNHLSEVEKATFGLDNIATISAENLSFSSEEIRKHFASFGHTITQDEAEELYRYTEGWIIALNTIAVSGNIDISNENQKLSIKNFIEKNIWQDLEPGLQDFLMKTAVPDRFTADLCALITDNKDYKTILNRLVNGNINISLMGDHYRYHPLFLDFLREQLEHSALDRAELNKTVANYYLNNGDFLTAKNFAMKSGDMMAISQTIKSFYSIRTFSLEEYVEFHRLYHLDQLPEAIIKRNPLLHIAQIFFAYLTGDVKKLYRLIDGLFPILDIIARKHPESYENAISILLMDCRVRLSDFGQYIKPIPMTHHVHPVLQSPTYTFQLPFLHRCARDFYEILDPPTFEEIRGFSKNLIKDNLDLMFYGAKACLLMEKNDLNQALEEALSLKSAISEKMSPEFVYAHLILVAELYLLLNQKEKYYAMLKEIKTYIKTSSSQYLLKNLTAYESKKKLQNGQKADAELWLNNYFVNNHSFHEFYKIYQNFVTARAYIVLNRFDEGTKALEIILNLAKQYDRFFDMAEANVLLSIIEWSSGNKKEAQHRLSEVLKTLFNYKFLRIIANEGNSILPILSAIKKEVEKEASISDEYRQFVRQVYKVTYEHSKHYKGLTFHSKAIPVRLSAQQKKVLNLLAEGHNNAEIVSITGLSLNTIRTHTKVAYKKLDVNSAAAAITKAKAQGLL